MLARDLSCSLQLRRIEHIWHGCNTLRVKQGEERNDDRREGLRILRSSRDYAEIDKSENESLANYYFNDSLHGRIIKRKEVYNVNLIN